MRSIARCTPVITRVSLSTAPSTKLWLSVPTELGFKIAATLSEDKVDCSASETTADIVVGIALTSIDTRPCGGPGGARVGREVSISEGAIS